MDVLAVDGAYKSLCSVAGEEGECGSSSVNIKLIESVGLESEMSSSDGVGVAKQSVPEEKNQIINRLEKDGVSVRSFSQYYQPH